jgi:Terminase large subunit, T4likevirus-type, N-terminal
MPEINLTAPQWRVFVCRDRFRVLVAGRRFGKTFLALTELVQAAWEPGRMAWYVAPTYKQAKRIAWGRLKALTKPYWAGAPNETDLSVRLTTGGTIALRGANDYDSLRGEGLDFVVLDEFASMQPAAWSQVLRPSLSDRQGKALFIGTPQGYNHFYELYEKAKSQPDWAAFKFTTVKVETVCWKSPRRTGMAGHHPQVVDSRSDQARLKNKVRRDVEVSISIGTFLCRRQSLCKRISHHRPGDQHDEH